MYMDCLMHRVDMQQLQPFKTFELKNKKKTFGPKITVSISMQIYNIFQKKFKNCFGGSMPYKYSLWLIRREFKISGFFCISACVTVLQSNIAVLFLIMKVIYAKGENRPY